MRHLTRIFTLLRTRSAQGVIADASGWTGCWPFRRRVSYHVGVNCDSISISDRRLYVRRRGWVIAVANATPATAFRWSSLFHPRHSGKHSPWAL